MPRLLRTARLVLRPVQESDLDLLLVHWRRPLVRRYLCDDREIECEFAAAFIARSITSNDAGLGMWRVEAGGELSGVVWLERISEGLETVSTDVELMVSLEPQHWGRGYATEATRVLLAYAFETLRLPRVLADTDPPNLESLAVIARLGMRPLSPSPIPRAQYFALDASYAPPP